MRKTVKNMSLFLFLVIITAMAIIIYKESVSASEYPFIIEDTRYGIEDDAVRGKKLTITEENTEIYNPSTYDKNLYKGYVYVKQTLDDKAVFYLITSQGCVASYTAAVDYEPQDKPIAWPLDGKYMQGNLVYDFPYSLYLIYRPDTEKYDMLNATTGEYYAHQIDYAWEDGTHFPIVKAENDGKFGVINIQGEMIHEPIYDEIRVFDNYVRGYINEKGYQILARDGSQSEEFFNSVGENSGDMLAVSDANTHHYGVFSLDTMKLIEPCVHERVISSEDGVYTLRDTFDDKETEELGFKICVVTQDGTWDINEQFGGSCVASSNIWNAQDGVIQDGKISIRILGDLNEHGNRELIFAGYVSTEGEYVSEHTSRGDGGLMEHFITYGYYNGLLLKERNSTSYEEEFKGQLVTSQGDVVLDCISLDNVSELGDDLICARNADGYLIYDTVNNEILLEGIQFLEKIYPEGSGLVVTPYGDDSKFGIYNMDTREMSGYIFENNIDWSDEIKEYSHENKKIWHCVNEDGNSVLINELFEIIDSGQASLSTIDENLNIVWNYQQKVAQSQYQKYKKITDNQGVLIAEFPYYYDSEGVMSPYVTRTDLFSNQYGMVSNYGEVILNEEYNYIGKCWHDLSYVELDGSGRKGIVDTGGQFLLQGDFNDDIYFGDKSIALQDAVISFNDAEDASVCYIYSFEEFVKVPGDFEPLKIVDTYPSNGSAGVSLQTSSDIRITFNRNVSIFNDRPGDSLGSVQIKEYDTDETILEYNMVSGSKVGQIVYLDSKTAKNSILLKNAMTMLDRGKQYYILMDEYCIAEEGDSHNPVWFEGISDKDDFTFRVGSNNQVLSDVTYLSACALVQNSLDGCEGMTVEEYVNSDYFQNESIWEGSTITYRRLFLDVLGGYTISDILEPTVYNAGITTLVSESENRVIFAFKSIVGTIATEQYFTDGYKNYAAIKNNYTDKSIVLTGENGAGALAAYICGVDNHTTRTFNAPIVAGLDLAFANNINLITQYHGIENIPCKNYSCNLFSGIDNGEYWNVRLADNPNGDNGNLNQILEYGDSFSFTSVKSEHKASGLRVKTIMNAEDALKTVQSFFDNIASQDPFGLLIGMISEGTEVVLGSSEGDYWRPTRLNPEVVYTGGATSSDPDEFYGSGKGNMFNFSGGTAVLYGSSGQDAYFINSTSGNVTINDYTDVSYKLSEINNVYGFMNFAKFGLEDFKGPELKDFIETGKIISGISDGTDVIYVNIGEVNQNQITETDKYYQFQIADCIIQIQKRNTPIMVLGLNNTSVTLMPNQARNAARVLGDSSVDEEKDYSVRGLLLKGEDITYDVYAEGMVVESEQITGENVIGTYHYSVVQEETGEFCLNVNDDVEKVVITGGTLESVRVGSSSDSTVMYVFDVTDNTKQLEVNYGKNAVLYAGEETEVVYSPQDEKNESEPTLLGLSITPPEQTVYEVGEELNLTGLKVYKCYSDGTCTEISDYQVQGFDNTVAGRQEIQIIEGENTNTFSVEVYEADTLIIDISVPEKISLISGAEKLLEVTYLPDTIYDSELVITSSNESVVHIRGSYLVGGTPGETEITVSDKYGRVKKTCKVTVSDVLVGDIDANGVVNLFDLMQCLNHVSGKTVLTDNAFTAADVDQNGVVDLFDLMRILNYVSGKSATV